MRLTLIRHAESNHTQQGFIAGLKGCTGLTSHGFTQVKRLSDRLLATGELSDCRVILTSPVLRAVQTTQEIAKVLPTAQIEPVASLVEQLPGDSDGLSQAEFRQKYGNFDPFAHPDQPFPPNGETWSQFLDRVRSFLTNLTVRFENQHVVAVTHAGFIVVSYLILFDILQPTPGAFRAFIDPAHTGITQWHKTNTTWVLDKYNDVLHLNFQF